jgi:hypothetical protein
VTARAQLVGVLNDAVVNDMRHRRSDMRVRPLPSLAIPCVAQRRCVRSRRHPDRRRSRDVPRERAIRPTLRQPYDVTDVRANRDACGVVPAVLETAQPRKQIFKG